MASIRLVSSEEFQSLPANLTSTMDTMRDLSARLQEQLASTGPKLDTMLDKTAVTVANANTELPKLATLIEGNLKVLNEAIAAFEQGMREVEGLASAGLTDPVPIKHCLAGSEPCGQVIAIPGEHTGTTARGTDPGQTWRRKMTNKFLPLAWLLSLGLLLVGCGSSPPNNFYVLSAHEFPAPSGTAPALGVGPINIPEYLGRQNMVYSRVDNTLQVASLDMWAEPLGAGIQRVLVLNLTGLLNTQDVSTFPVAPRAGAGVRRRGQPAATGRQ